MKETDNKDVKFKCTSESSLPFGKLEVTIKGSEFKNYDLSIVKSKEDKRYNLKLYDTDIALLDELSAVSGVSRNTLIAFVMDEVLMNLLREIEAVDTAVLIAGAADALAGEKVADLNVPWVTKYFQHRVDTAYENTMNYGEPNSPDFSDEELELRSNLAAEMEKAIAAGDKHMQEKIQQEIYECSGHSASFFAVKEKLAGDAK